MSRVITWVTALVTSTACTLLADVAAAEPPSSTRATGVASTSPVAVEPPVDVVLVGRAGTEGSLAERIRSWFGASTTLSVKTEPELVAERVLGPLPSRRVAVWVTLRTPTEARLYFAVSGETQETTRYLLRDVPLNQGFDEIGSERVAQVVHSSVTALIEGSIDAAERPEIARELEALPAASSTERVSPAPVAVPPPVAVPQKSQEKKAKGPSVSPLAGVFYRGAYAGDEGFPHGPGAMLGATFHFDRFGIGAIARVEYVFPHTERMGELDVTLGGTSARLGARGEWLPSPNVHLDLELGAGLFYARYDPQPTLAGPTPAERGVDPRFFEFASAGVSGDVGPLRMGGRFELEFYPVQSHYELDTGQRIGSNARLQPGFVFEVVFD